jgi:hypothetical protein
MRVAGQAVFALLALGLSFARGQNISIVQTNGSLTAYWLDGLRMTSRTELIERLAAATNVKSRAEINVFASESGLRDVFDISGILYLIGVRTLVVSITFPDENEVTKRLEMAVFQRTECWIPEHEGKTFEEERTRLKAIYGTPPQRRYSFELPTAGPRSEVMDDAQRGAP